MNTFWKTKYRKNDVLPAKRRLHFRSTSDLIARRKRLRQQIGIALAMLIGVGMLMID